MSDPALPMEDVATAMLDAPRCHLGEGPTYDPATNIAWWFDIIERRLFEADLAGTTVVSHALPVMASMLAIAEDGRQLLAAENGLYVRDPASGRMALHVPLEADRPDTRSNDARVHPSGALWIGTMGRHAEHGAGSIYHMAGGQLQCLYAGLSIPNAICFAPGGGTGYFADTRGKASCTASRSIPQPASRPLARCRCTTTGAEAGWTARWSMPRD